MHSACYEKDIGLLQALFESISDTDTGSLSVCNQFGWTPLHVSVFLNHIDAVRLLLSKGADVFLPTVRGHTALHLACYRGDVDMVRLLMRGGSTEMTDDNKFDKLQRK